MRVSCRKAGNQSILALIPKEKWDKHKDLFNWVNDGKLVKVVIISAVEKVRIKKEKASKEAKKE